MNDIQGYVTAAQIEEFQRKVEEWGKSVNTKLISSVQAKMKMHDENKMRDKHSGKRIETLAKSLKSKVKKGSDGLPERVSFSFLKQGIYVHYGVGKKRPITNPGTPIDWFNTVLTENFNELSLLVDQFMGGLVINNAKMMIPDIDMRKGRKTEYEKIKGR